MDSKDIRIVISGQEFVIEGSALRPAGQNSFQQEVLRRLDGIESRLGAVETEQKTMYEEQLILRTRVDMLIYGGGIGLTLICAVIAWTSLFAPRFWDSKGSQQNQTPSQPDTQSITNSLIDAFSKGVTAGRRERM
ncbi:MAG: hypothetical protein IJP54_05995 [Synergistaceae bacterium]|nr:hypothetical protein [Synergistaceae bacterium]